MMEKDKFEGDIDKIRSQLDLYDPPANTWNTIKKEVFKNSTKKRQINWWKIAASILLFISASLAILMLQQQQNPIKMGDLSPAYHELEMNYQHEIQETYARLPLDEINTEDIQWLIEELALVDSIQTEYQQELTDERNQERIIEVLIDQYEKKLKILRKLELEINRQQNEKGLTIS